MLTKCTYCGEHSRIQQEGNGCHTCLKGIMVRDREIKDAHTSSYKHFED